MNDFIILEGRRNLPGAGERGGAGGGRRRLRKTEEKSLWAPAVMRREAGSTSFDNQPLSFSLWPPTSWVGRKAVVGLSYGVAWVLRNGFLRNLPPAPPFSKVAMDLQRRETVKIDSKEERENERTRILELGFYSEERDSARKIEKCFSRIENSRYWSSEKLEINFLTIFFYFWN